MANDLEFSIPTEAELKAAVAALTGWAIDGPAIAKTFEWPTFLEGIAFVNRVAILAEKINHHPDVDIRYKKITVRLWTHKKNATTQADLVLAKEIEGVV